MNQTNKSELSTYFQLVNNDEQTQILSEETRDSVSFGQSNFDTKIQYTQIFTQTFGNRFQMRLLHTE